VFQCYHHHRHAAFHLRILGDSPLHTDAAGTAPPDAFGPFRVLHQIGVGVLGPVYRAYQPDPGRLVAVKLFRVDLQPDLAVRFVSALERLIASDLTHMGIAAPLATGTVDGSPYLALDFVAAESFDVVVRDYGPAPATEALRIATQLGGALDFAAAVGVLHGSLHPRDVLVSTDDTRVTGLGIGQALEAVGVTPPVRRPYTAPERIAGQAWDRRADVFSVAALVTEMLCGRRLAGTGVAAAEGIPEIDGANIDDLRSVIARALADDPSHRYETALAFVEALHAAFVRPSARPTPPRRRRRDADPLRPRPTSESVTSPEPPLMLFRSEPATGDETPVTAAPEPAVHQDGETGDPDAAVLVGRDAAAEPPPPSDRTPEGDTEFELDRKEPGHSAPEIDARIGDFELRRAEEERYSSVESAPAIPDASDVPEVDLPVHDALQTSPRSEPKRPRRARTRGSQPVEAPPAPTTDEPSVPAPSVVPPPATRIAQEGHELTTLSGAALAESRSAVWPILLALFVGGMVGFALGFGAGSRDRNAQAAAQAQADAPEAASLPSVSQPAQTAPSSPVPASGEPTRTPSPDTAASGRGQTARGTEHGVPESRDRSRGVTPERPPGDIGRLLVRSSPQGAGVSLDGRSVGTTPLTLRDVAVGTHVLRVTHQGYIAAEQRVRISAAQPAQSIEVELAAARPERPAAQAPAVAPVPKAGSLIVDSRPSGARVLIDGRLVGTTPFLLDEVSVGDHAVRLELDGFAPWSTSAHVSGGERTRVSGSLEQQ
jgi:serine/threonine protein kinase